MSNYATFGDLIFTTPDTGIEIIDNEIGQDLATYNLATGKPLVVFVGEKLRKLTIKIKMYNVLANIGVGFKDDIKAFITEVEKMVGSGDAYMLMLASGVYQGSYLLASVKDSIKETLPNGTITHYEATLELLEQDRLQNSSVEAVIRKKGKKQNTETWDSTKIIEHREKKEYADLMKSKKFMNPLYAAYTYGKKVLL